MYNLTNTTNANNVFEIFREINALSSGLFALCILFVVFILSFIALKNYDTKSGFVASSFVTTIIAGLFLAINLISYQIFLFPFILFIASLLFKIFTD